MPAGRVKGMIAKGQWVMQSLCTIRDTSSFGQLLGILWITSLEGCIMHRSSTPGRVL